MTDRATVAFVRDVLGRRAPIAWPRTEAVWHDVIRFTSSHLALPAFAALAEELGLDSSGAAAVDSTKAAAAFLADILENNRARNAALAAETLRLAGVLVEDRIPVIALKGAAFLFDGASAHDHAAWRFMGDIDLLVPPDRLLDAVACLEGLGYVSVHDRYDPSRDAHVPPLIGPDGEAMIELHDRLFACDPLGLEIDRLWADAVLADASAALLVPNRTHRLHHLIMHAQLHNRQYPLAQLLLKDVVDFETLTAKDGGAALDELLAVLVAPDHRAAARAFIAGCEAFLDRGPGLPPDAAARAWAGKAIFHLTPHSPVWYRGATDALKVEVYRLRCERGHMRHRLRQCIDLGALRHASSSWGYKARQRYWG